MGLPWTQSLAVPVSVSVSVVGIPAAVSKFSPQFHGQSEAVA